MTQKKRRRKLNTKSTAVIFFLILYFSQRPWTSWNSKAACVRENRRRRKHNFQKIHTIVWNPTFQKTISKIKINKKATTSIPTDYHVTLPVGWFQYKLVWLFWFLNFTILINLAKRITRAIIISSIIRPLLPELTLSCIRSHSAWTSKQPTIYKTHTHIYTHAQKTEFQKRAVQLILARSYTVHSPAAHAALKQKNL